jgi:lipopolysaccharide export system protein LptC
LGLLGNIFGKGLHRKGRESAPVPTQSESSEKAYQLALGHSRRVQFLRRFIPLATAVAFVGPLLWGIVSPFARQTPDITVGKASVTGTKITMEFPKLSGFKKDMKGYEVTAQEATQDMKTPSIVELNKLTARMEQEKNSFARLTSDWGRFDQTANRLDLKGNVQVRTDSGYQADLMSANVDIKSGNVLTREAVTVKSNAGEINADSMDMRDNGKHVIFEGRVRSVVTPSDSPPAENQDIRP